VAIVFTIVAAITTAAQPDNGSIHQIVHGWLGVNVGRTATQGCRGRCQSNVPQCLHRHNVGSSRRQRVGDFACRIVHVLPPHDAAIPETGGCCVVSRSSIHSGLQKVGNETDRAKGGRGQERCRWDNFCHRRAARYCGICCCSSSSSSSCSGNYLWCCRFVIVVFVAVTSTIVIIVVVPAMTIESVDREDGSGCCFPLLCIHSPFRC